jgi:hypothetical protein
MKDFGLYLKQSLNLEPLNPACHGDLSGVARLSEPGTFEPLNL